MGKLMTATRWQVVFHDGGKPARVVVEAASVVDAVKDVCDAHELPYRAVIEVKKVR
jgi:enamine deaminase RidA (YjgF/YER057c/UK114 family)